MKLKVEFLDTYTITTEDQKTLSFNNINSPKLAILLAYILYHHRHKLSSIDLQELMFTNNSSSNPANALKALIFRLRGILNKYLGKYDYILSSQGTYYWNSEIELEFDVDSFVNYYRLGRNELDDDKKVKYYQKALLLYQGSFLPMINTSDKLMNIRHYLNSHFLNVTHFLIEYYLNKNEFSIAEEVCQSALIKNEADDNINCALVFALVKQGKLVLAREHYYKVKNLLSNNAVNKMAHYLDMNQVSSHEIDFNVIYADLNEKPVNGAFVCDYELFKSVYQLALRTSFRNGAAKSIILLTLHPKKYIIENPKINNLVLEETSNTLQQILISTFRLGDVVCKYSIKQFLVLLDCDYTGASKAIKRVKKKFYLQEKYDRVVIDESIVELDENMKK
ncbi:bacterial transcriptional activator domain-containing protein [Thomasclavelia sp.]|uniref:bacterial transcriptional activator domain-containing protein n=1 Tax=Thomasclavelia sp. TaxID=3025757 RepID=UPI0025DD7012|nr:bacterial transcriptional activator domain-containing protein [Thomasclavelia sp.]